VPQGHDLDVTGWIDSVVEKVANAFEVKAA